MRISDAHTELSNPGGIRPRAAVKRASVGEIIGVQVLWYITGTCSNHAQSTIPTHTKQRRALSKEGSR